MGIDKMVESFKRMVDMCCPNWYKEHGSYDLVPVSALTLPKTYETDYKLGGRVKQILDEVKDCRIVSWDLWELGDHFSVELAKWDFLNNSTNWTLANKRVQYCATKDEFMSEMMGLSLAHEIVEMKAVKSMDGSHGIIMILVCPDGDGHTNIDADLIESLASFSGH